jgi:hypothetical protein
MDRSSFLAAGLNPFWPFFDSTNFCFVTRERLGKPGWGAFQGEGGGAFDYDAGQGDPSVASPD